MENSSFNHTPFETGLIGAQIDGLLPRCLDANPVGLGQGSKMVSITCPNHSDIILAGLWNSFSNQNDVDFDLEWGNRAILVHHFLLKLFLSPGQLVRRGQVFTDRAEVDQLDFVLKFLYKGNVSVREDELDKLLAVAAELEFPALVDAIVLAKRQFEGDVTNDGLITPKLEIQDDTAQILGYGVHRDFQIGLDPSTTVAEVNPDDQHAALVIMGPEAATMPSMTCTPMGDRSEEANGVGLLDHSNLRNAATTGRNYTRAPHKRSLPASEPDCDSVGSYHSVMKITRVLGNQFYEANGDPGIYSEGSELVLTCPIPDDVQDCDDGFVSKRDFKKLQNDYIQFKESTLRRLEKMSQSVNYFELESTPRAEKELNDFCLPVNTAERFEELNNWVSIEENRNCLMSRLAKVGGYSLQNVVRGILKRIIGRDLCVNFTFTGKYGKTCLKGTNIHHLVIGITESSEYGKGVPFREIDMIMQRWINGAKDRNCGRVKNRPKSAVVQRPCPTSISIPASTIVQQPLDYFTLPLPTVESYDELNVWLTDARNKITLIKELIKIGGCNTDTITRRILRRTISNDLCIHISFSGKCRKRSIKETKMHDLIMDTVIHHEVSKNATFQQIDSIIKRWFHGSRDRIYGRSRGKTLAVESFSEMVNPDEIEATT